MKYRLRSYDQVPPGGFRYRNFTEPVIEGTAKRELAFRRGNNLPRATYAECLVDVDRYMANHVLKGNPAYTVPIEENSNELPISPDSPGLKPCKGCGVPVETS